VSEKSSTDPAVSRFVLAGGKSLRMGRLTSTVAFSICLNSNPSGADPSTSPK
jgi:hypothetical protein